MKTWEIYRYTYKDVCSDSWFVKEGRYRTIGFVTDTEDNVKSLVDKLNVSNKSYYGKEKPEDEFDRDYCDKDYISYAELKINTLEEIEKNFIRYR